ncbi:hypothetical protein BR93DRAFT_966269 [Coniochaeta sp. PMI_546]|nr:hypothetical protein BR93DRAFT_966269 [Coniochaeta sp. PMI_546]
MDSPRPQVDLEKELTCSICTELLYQPLTLLDCLHTFCGACLKEWFTWQATAAENAPSPPPDPDTGVYTCPSCRARVRDTRHNATVATLLEMFLAANPDKMKDQKEREEMDAKYKPGEKVLRKVRERSAGERRLEEEERRLVERVREMSLREAVGGSARERRRGESRSRTTTRSRDVSTDGGGSARERARRPAAAGGSEQPGGLRIEGEGRRRRSASRQTGGDESPGRRERRHIEHQSSIRSLISTGDNRDMSQSDVDREIEDFARQIQEEGLLEGLDLDNLDLSNNDELSRKITEAYRRRQRQRSRHDGARRSNASGHSHHSDPDNGSRLRVSSRQSRSRSSSQTGPAEDRSRPPTSSGAAHLAVQAPRPRRRTASGGRSATVPVGISQPEPRVAARSQTDLSLQTSTSDVLPGRPLITNEGRSTSTPTMTTAAGTVSNSPITHSIPFSARAAAASTGLGIHHPPQATTSTQHAPDRPSTSTSLTTSTSTSTTSQPPSTIERTPRPRPADILISPSFPSAPDPLSPSHSPLLSPLPTSHKRTRSQLYPEPSLTCKRCQRPHIEYTLHYNCSLCHQGTYNLCLDCYRRGKGCLHWFGFGYGAWRAYTNALLRDPDGRSLPKPHMLTANRYRPPRVLPGGAEGRVTLTSQNPELRLESGTFCARCERWTTWEVHWRCEGCNEGDWGFCTECVGTGRGCTHDLLALKYVPPLLPPAAEKEGGGDGDGVAGQVLALAPPPLSPRGPRGRVSVQTGAEETAIGPFRPVVVTARCEVCGRDVQPREERLHCYACQSGGEQGGGGAGAGEWEVCEGCYGRLEAEGRVSAENGRAGWRRCLAGHRMAVVAFVEGGADGVLRRRVVRDWVGGRTLGFEEYAPGLQVCYWMEHGVRRERLVTRDVAAAAEVDVGVRTRWTEGFPPDGGGGGRAVARWAWYPAEGAEDELMFPKGAEVREIEDVNGEWFHGVYMGAKGLFPAPYVVPLAGSEGP